MGYSTENDIIKALPEETLIELTDDNESQSIDSPKVVEAISKADGEIDTYISNRYPLPLSSVPAILRGFSVDIAIYLLYKRKVEEIPETRRTAYKDAIKTLVRISDGKMDLPISAAGSSGFSVGIVETSHF